jgi:PAS domain S-box-containing protein
MEWRRGVSVHRLLQRQLQSLAESGGESFAALVDIVNRTYTDFAAEIERHQAVADRSADELSTLREDLRTVFRVFPGLCLRLDEAGIIVEVSGCEEGGFAGMKREQLVGRQLWEADLVDDPDSLLAMFRKRDIGVREFVRHRRGEKLWCELHLLPMEDHTTVVALRDVTGLRAKTAQLAAAEERYRNLFESASEGIFVATVEGCLEAVNPAFAAMFGYEDPEQLKHSSVEFVSQLFFDPREYEELLLVLQRQGQVKELELRHKHRNGSIVWVSANVRLVRKEGRYYLSGSLRDITKRREAEIALQVAHDQLEERVRERTAQLTRANEELQLMHSELHHAKEHAEAANRLKSEFLANMSHEIRTPMNGILGLSQMILRSTISEAQRGNVEGIHSSGMTLLQIINDILDISKIEAGKLNVVAEPVDLHALVEEVISITTVNNSKGVEMRLELGAGVPQHILSDRVRLHQVLVNLVGNAVKFTKKGFVLLAIDFLPNPSDNDLGKLAVRVVDTGTGIKAAKKKEIFRSFNQGDSSISREFGGTGLGLTISQRIVRLLGGNDITLESQEGRGSVFSFVLPVRLVAPTEDQGAEMEVEVDFSGRDDISILAAEDWELNRVLLGQILKDIGIANITFANNGKEAVDAVLQGSKSYSLILMDIQMPVMGGIEATRIIRSAFPNLPILAVTAHAMKQDKQQCLAAGMNDYLSKPYRIEEIILALKRVLG